SVWGGWDPLQGSPTHWHSATVAGWLRSWLGGAPRWPMLVVPAAAVIWAVWLGWIHRHRVPFDVMPGLLAASVLLTPYAWGYDSVLLLPIHVLAVGAYVQGRPHGRAALLAAIGIQLAALVVREMS